MATNLTLDIDYEMADKITVENLKDTYENLCCDIWRLNSMDSLESHQQEDLRDFKRNRKAIKKTLKYFMSHTEAKEYFNGR